MDVENRKLVTENFYKKSDEDLNSTYNSIKDYIENKSELTAYINVQRGWLKKRNDFCKYNDELGINAGNIDCLTNENRKRVDYLKLNYLNFNDLEKNIVRPFSYKNNKKIINYGGCFCTESMLQIIKNKMLIYQVCDEKLESPLVFDIVSKKYGLTNVEYELDQDGNKTVDFSLSFVLVGKNVWKIVSKTYGKKELTELNYDSNYTIESNLEKEEQDFGDFDG